MNHLACLLAVVTVSIPALAQTDAASEIAELKRRIAALEAAQADTERAAQAKQQTDAAVNAVIDDAQRRATPLKGSAGWDDGFKIQSEDGNYQLRVYGQLLFRYVANSLGEVGRSESSFDQGFEMRRLKLGVRGHMISKDLTYNFRFALGRNNSTVSTEDAFIQYMFAPQWGVKVGQFKGNVFREETSASYFQLPAERSLLNERLAGGVTDFVQGVAGIYRSESFRSELAATDGHGSANTDFKDQRGPVIPPSTSPDNRFRREYGFMARGEYKLTGDWKSYDDFTALDNKQNFAAIGAGSDYTVGGDSWWLSHTADAQVEVGAAGIYVAYVGMLGELDGGQTFYDLGALAQMGYVIPGTRWEPFVRYDFIVYDQTGLASTANDFFNEITVGVNYYYKRHAAKFTLDLVFLPDGFPTTRRTAVVGAGSGMGAIESEIEQVILRGQFNLLF
jgi:hypothetical protein